MKKLLSFVVAAALLPGLAACGPKAAPPEKKPQRIYFYGGGSGALETDTAYEYDEKGNVIRTERYSGGELISTTAYKNTYNKKGRLLRVDADGGGGTSSWDTYEYNAGGLLLRHSAQDFEGATAEEAYEYNAGGQVIRIERSGTMLVDGVASLIPMPYTGYTENAYDAEGRMVLSESHEGDYVTQTTYTYNALGQKIREDTRSADGIVCSSTYEYDAEGLLSRKSYYTDVGTPYEWLEAYEIYKY